MKKLFAGILLCVLVFSVLPVRELTKLCFKSQSTEQVHNDDCTGDDDGMCKLKKEIDPFTVHGHHSDTIPVAYQATVTNISFRSTIAIPEHFVPNVPTPPPDRA